MRFVSDRGDSVLLGLNSMSCLKGAQILMGLDHRQF